MNPHRSSSLVDTNDSFESHGIRHRWDSGSLQRSNNSSDNNSNPYNDVRTSHGMPKTDLRASENDKDERLETETDAAIDLFATTLRSLAADARAVREVSDVLDVLQNGDFDAASAEGVAEKLRALDAAVASLEHKVTVLRTLINEEHAALQKFETTLRTEADDQAELIRSLMEALERRERDRQQQQRAEEEAAAAREEAVYQQQLQQESWDEQQLQQESWDEDPPSTSVRGFRYGSMERPLAVPNTNLHTPGSVSSVKSHESGASRSSQPQSGSIFRDRAARLSSAGSTSSVNSQGSAAAHSSSNNNNPPKSIFKGVLRSRSSSGKGPLSSSQATTTTTGNNTASRRRKVVVFRDDTGARSSGTNHTPTTRTPNHKTPPTKPSFVPVTDEELSRHTRYGPHMCRYDINEALEEIEAVVWKNTLLNQSSSARKKKNNSSYHPFHHSRQNHSYRSSSFDEESDHEQQQQQQQPHPSSSHLVSEQDLRENCAFFRHGESTARSTLQLLCSLKRLKQVPNKHGEITYLCLFCV